MVQDGELHSSGEDITNIRKEEEKKAGKRNIE